MSLPKVDGWVIDYRSARIIFESGNNSQISHCVEQCQAGTLHICHTEEKFFKDSESLKNPFIMEQNCVHALDNDVIEACQTVSNSPLAQKKFLTGDNVSVLITAIALSKRYGVISDHQSIVYITSSELCALYGVPALSVEDYFALLL